MPTTDLNNLKDDTSQFATDTFWVSYLATAQSRDLAFMKSLANGTVLGSPNGKTVLGTNHSVVFTSSTWQLMQYFHRKYHQKVYGFNQDDRTFDTLIACCAAHEVGHQLLPTSDPGQWVNPADPHRPVQYTQSDGTTVLALMAHPDYKTAQKWSSAVFVDWDIRDFRSRVKPPRFGLSYDDISAP